MRLLKDLRVDEVSAVMSGANPGARIKFMKRDDSSDIFNKIFGVAAPYDAYKRSLDGDDDPDRLAKLLAAYKRAPQGRMQIVRKADADDGYQEHEDGGIKGPWGAGHDDETRLEEISAPQARRILVRWLTGTAEGQKVMRRLENMTNKREAIPMENIAVRVAKAINVVGRSRLSEHELTGMITDYAKRLYPNLPPAVAFSKVFGGSDERAVLFRKSVAIAKGDPLFSKRRAVDMRKEYDPWAAGYQNLSGYARPQPSAFGSEGTEGEIGINTGEEGSLSGSGRSNLNIAPDEDEPDAPQPEELEAEATGGMGKGGSAYAKLDARAVELRKRDPSLTKEMAFAKAVRLYPALFAQERAQSRARLFRSA